jgi:hypothetical protein
MSTSESRSSRTTCANTEESEANIVPAGFEVTAHRIFSKFKRPTFDAPRSPSPYHSHDQARRGVDYLPRAIGSKVRASHLDLSCPICLREQLLDPVTLCGCTHSFCLNCLERWLNVAETCPLCKTEIGAFVSAAPDAHRLFTRPTDTSRALQGDLPIDGMADALEVQRTLHRLLREQRTSAHLAEAEGTGETSSKSSSLGGDSTRSSSSSGTSCSSEVSRNESSRPASSDSHALPNDSVLGKRSRDTTSDDSAAGAKPARTRRVPVAQLKSMAQMLNHLDGDIAEARATLEQLERASL